MTRTWMVVSMVVSLVLGSMALGAEEAQKSSVWSQLDVQIYGRLKADVSYDGARVEPGNYVKWVTKGGERDDETNLTANESRLGFNIKGPNAGSVKTSGKVEIDFYGTGSSENKSGVMMRHAYILLDFPQWSLLAGQTSDIISPLAPRTLNYSVLWWTGNIGYRRPQFRFTKQMELCKDTKLKIDAGIVRTIGDSITPADPEAGETFGPTAQGRVGLTIPGFVKPVTVGVSGHYGKEEYIGNKEIPTWSANVDALVPLMKTLTLKAECFTGENLDAYLGGIGQGIRTTPTKQGIDSRGGWAALEMEAGKGWSLTGGIGIDDPDTDDLAAGARDFNRCIFGNAIYAVNKNAKIGFELSQWRTEYKGSECTDDIRGQFSVIYEF